jgi:Na+-transporting methylmalonyl-CoA/oxaloacetate decarboxylase gamma subunit
MRKLFQAALGAGLCIGIAAGLIYSPFPLFWEHEDEPRVYSMTWRSAIVLLVLVLLTQWISHLIFRWIGRHSPVEIKSMRTKMRRNGRTKLLYVIAVLAAVITAGSVLWFNWDRVLVRRYEMSIAFDGKAPWGEVGAESTTAGAPTVLFRVVGNGYCYTAFQLPSLRDRLEHENKSRVTVEYNVFITFGHEGKYTLRSVDGVPLATGNRVIRETREFGGQMVSGEDETLNCP